MFQFLGRRNAISSFLEAVLSSLKRITKVKLLFLVVGCKKNLFLKGAKDILASVNKMLCGEGAARLPQPPASYATHCLMWLGVL